MTSFLSSLFYRFSFPLPFIMHIYLAYFTGQFCRRGFEYPIAICEILPPLFAKFVGPFKCRVQSVTLKKCITFLEAQLLGNLIEFRQRQTHSLTDVQLFRPYLCCLWIDLDVFATQNLIRSHLLWLQSCASVVLVDLV